MKQKFATPNPDPAESPNLYLIKRLFLFLVTSQQKQ